MTAHVSMARVPFAQLDNPRLQHLASAKNKQNGLISRKFAGIDGKANSGSPTRLASKRPFEPSVYEDVDSENIDPAVLKSPSKKSKSELFDEPIKPFADSTSSWNSMSPPSSIPARASTPARAQPPYLHTPLTAPAGRSPPRKTAGISRHRRVSASYSRINPPFWSGTSCALPFSLDAALSGTLSSAPRTAASATTTIQESMPKNWSFEIYEDTPGEEAANLMEHSTLTLDLSSDEGGSSKERDDRGKENTPPEGYDESTALRSAAATFVVASNPMKTTNIIRKKIVTDEMDDGERSPLSDLDTAPFIPVGLEAASEVTVRPAVDEFFTAIRPKLADATATPMACTLTPADASKNTSPAIERLILPSKIAEEIISGDIVVWEDGPMCEPVASMDLVSKEGNKIEMDHVVDENMAPAA